MKQHLLLVSKPQVAKAVLEPVRQILVILVETVDLVAAIIRFTNQHQVALMVQMVAQMQEKVKVQLLQNLVKLVEHFIQEEAQAAEKHITGIA